ncbi:MAG: glycosyltransferase family 4 protein [bacterium]|nr:glycosyltransferase family 4 protein [bacterium]
MKKRLKVVYVSSMLPSGHFSQYLTNAIFKAKAVDLIVYTDRNEKNLLIKDCGLIKPVWPKNLLYVFYTIKEVLKDTPDVIHIQQEFNMYGSIITAALFPFMPFFFVLLGYKVIVTIHAAVFKKQVNKYFISLFTHKKSFYINPTTLKFFFFYTYKLTSILSHQLICHTKLMRDILVEDYRVDPNKIIIIPTGIPEKKIPRLPKLPYFFYFGYMVKRKGLEYLLRGFRKLLNNKKYSHIKLIMAGGTISGQEKAFEEIVLLIKKLRLSESIEVKGFVEEVKLGKLYAQALAVVIPAKVSMGSSGPLYQAQSYNKCILASRIGHFEEDISDMKDGILVDNRHWDQGLAFVIDHPGKVEEIEAAVKNKSRTKSIKNIAQKHIKVYESF